MASIDQYKHLHLGFIECPSSHDFVFANPTRYLAIYELLESVPLEEEYLAGNVGDIIVGGGRGEVPALRIILPVALLFLSDENYDGFTSYKDLIQLFWTPTQAYILTDGFVKLGYSPNNEDIEYWLLENICSLIVKNIPKYKIYDSSEWVESKLKLL